MASTILIVDDSVTIRNMVRGALAGTADAVVEAADGLGAIRALEMTQPDLVITDLLMPGMDGLTLARTIRADPRHRDLTILVLTTEERPDTREQGRQAGVNGWLTKPFRPDTLRATVTTLLGRVA